MYANTPLGGMGQAQQAKVLQEWARKVLQEKNPEAEVSDPDRGLCCNGSRRGLNQSPYDFLAGARRVEIKVPEWPGAPREI